MIRARRPVVAPSVCRALALASACLVASCGASPPRANPVASSPPPRDAGAPPGRSRDTTLGDVDLSSRLAASTLRLDADEDAVFRREGFVLRDRKHFRSFVDGWLAIYKADLPLYVTVDSILHALHRSYDTILTRLEVERLASNFEAMLSGMRQRLAADELRDVPTRAKRDVDLLLTTTLTLLRGGDADPVYPDQRSAIEALVAACRDARGLNATLFGSPRAFDFSQCKPRGHYTKPIAAHLAGSGAMVPLANYFRAMSFAGRAEAAFVRIDGSGRPSLDRRQLELTLALGAVTTGAELALWNSLEKTMDTFVGPRDALGPDHVGELWAALGVRTFSELARVPDDAALRAILASHVGEQRILSQIQVYPVGGPHPLPRVLSLTGQRYTPDAQVLSDVVFPNVAGRLMPDALDVAYAALGNERARSLLGARTANGASVEAYVERLDRERTRLDGEGEAAWDSSLYRLWLGSLRAVSSTDPATVEDVLPAVRPEPWATRVIAAELASWAELRHDTILYAKASYTGGVLCSFPDGRVDPYPAAFDRLARMGVLGQRAVDELATQEASPLLTDVARYFERFASVASRLATIARTERAGAPLAAEDVSFLNGAVSEDPPKFGGCGAPPRVVHGWYVDLFFGGDPLAPAPIAADVHTQPTDISGNTVGRVLHAATGWPRLIVVNGGTPDRPRPYVGVSSTFVQTVRDGFWRFTDEAWMREIESGNPAPADWLRPVVVQ